MKEQDQLGWTGRIGWDWMGIELDWIGLDWIGLDWIGLDGLGTGAGWQEHQETNSEG